NESILDDVPFFAKYALTSLVTYIIPYAAALDVEIIDKYRKENTEKLSACHPFYFAVYEAKAHRLSFEKQFKHQSFKLRPFGSSHYEENSPFRTWVTSSCHNWGGKGYIACLCGYEFAGELLHL
uniref:Uncharacterized protein n=1 Tax=Romanomermis culicivorax TaxID=13658 RepID=A0A915HM84_ROMCU